MRLFDIGKIGNLPEDSNEELLRKRFLIYMGVLMSGGGILWGSISAYFNLFYPAIIPYGYTVLTVFNLYYFHKSKNFKAVRFFQVLISLLLPFIFQWSLGGFVHSGAVMLWALLALVGSLTFSDSKSNLKWLAIFLVFTVMSGLIEPFVEHFQLEVSNSVIVFFFCINIVTICSILFGLIFYITNKREQTNRELEEKNNQVEKLLQNIHQKNEELEDALSNLKQAQTQLIQNEKMAGLGTLVSGVAHEINNPTNFVYLTSHNLQTNIKDLKSFIFELADDDSEGELTKIFEEKFDRILGNISDLDNGSQRIKTIVQDLRTFSRLDESEIKHVDIIEGINSTLRIIRAKHKKEVEFIREFESHPVIDCWPAQLNQVFMNIMINACQAIKENIDNNRIKAPGKLIIRTFENGKSLGIEFTDNGCGMSKEVQKRIFEPFFTTKKVGSGVGMGMSITYGIIEKHQGNITVKSEPGEGSVITVYIPQKLDLKEHLKPEESLKQI